MSHRNKDVETASELLTLFCWETQLACRRGRELGPGDDAEGGGLLLASVNSE